MAKYMLYTRKKRKFNRLQIQAFFLPNIPRPPPSPSNIDPSNLFFVRIYAQGVLTRFYGLQYLKILLLHVKSNMFSINRSQDIGGRWNQTPPPPTLSTWGATTVGPQWKNLKFHVFRSSENIFVRLHFYQMYHFYQIYQFLPISLPHFFRPHLFCFCRQSGNKYICLPFNNELFIIWKYSGSIWTWYGETNISQIN